MYTYTPIEGEHQKVTVAVTDYFVIYNKYAPWKYKNNKYIYLLFICLVFSEDKKKNSMIN